MKNHSFNENGDMFYFRRHINLLRYSAFNKIADY